MKNKIVIFKVLAAIIAVGGAFASVSANSALVATSVYVRYTTATHVIKCTFVGTCETTGSSLCNVLVQIPGQSQQIIRGVVTIAPNNNTCATAIITNNSASGTINGATPKVLPVGAVLH